MFVIVSSLFRRCLVNVPCCLLLSRLCRFAHRRLRSQQKQNHNEWLRDSTICGFTKAIACLSALLAAGRYKELRDLLDLCSTKMWHYEKFAFQSLVDQGKKAEAIRLAQDMASQLNAPMHAIYEECEKVLLSSGLYEEAYEKL